MWAQISLLIFVPAVLAYPAGPPLDACEDMIPTGHGVEALDNADAKLGRIRIFGQLTNYTAEQEITLKIKGVYRGFFIQARIADGSSTDPVGTFKLVNEDDSQLLACGGIDESAVSHKDNNKKRGVKVIWVAPDDFTDDILFMATIVQRKERFWVGLESDVLEGPQEDYCASDPCLNGGTCTNEKTKFKCECASGFKGKTCDKDVCDPSPCKKNEVCTVSNKGKAKCSKK